MVNRISNEDETTLEDQETSDSEEYEEGKETPGMRVARLNADPTISLKEAQNATVGEGDNASGSSASSAEDYVPSNSDPNPTNLPSSDHPLPDDADNSDEETIGSAQSSSETKEGQYTH
jgi:hypothetical protein